MRVRLQGLNYSDSFLNVETILTAIYKNIALICVQIDRDVFLHHVMQKNFDF